MPRKVVPWIEPVVLEGKLIRLEPIKPKHAKELARQGEEDLFRYFTVHGPREQSVGAFKQYIAHLQSQPNLVAFAIVARGILQPIGMTCLLDIRPETAAMDIGLSWVGRDWEETPIYTEAMLLLLEHAFQRRLAERVQFKVDSRNVKEQQAIQQLGAVKEGVLRRDTITYEAQLRDTVVYSVIAAEWADVKAGLIRRLA